MKRDYNIRYEGKIVPFTIEAEDSVAFKAFESKMMFYKRVRAFYDSIMQSRQAVMMVDNMFDIEKEYLDTELLELLDG